MNKDKKVLYIVTLVIFAALLCLLFADIKTSRIALAITLLPLSVIARLCIKKKTSGSIYKREVMLLVIVIGALFVILLHMSGLYFGYYKNPYFVTKNIFLTFVLPLSVAIVSSELIRSTILAQKNKLASFICFLSCVLVETLMVSNIAGIKSFYRFMDVVGLALLPAISANIYYHYASKRFGMFPNIAYRAITTLYIYFLPTTPALQDALLSCVKIVLPILMLAILASFYEKNKKYARQKHKFLGKVGVALTIVIIAAVSMLISCQFRFGAIVVATESMTGEINKGDMIIYERYDDQQIKEGQVIVFLEEGVRVIHRVVRIDIIGSETRYYTKGDANVTLDFGYRTDADIVGLTDIKVSYVGYPTLWLRSLIKTNI